MSGRKTKFYSIHEELGAKIVDFAGFNMPVQYDSIIAEHLAVRNSVGLFDVSHMGEVFVTGNEALQFINYISTNDVTKLTDGKVQYSAMCYEDGGIVDDLLVYRFNENKFLLVINASNIDKDVDWINRNNIFDAVVSNESDDYSLLAVQGPDSKSVIQKICSSKIDLEYYSFLEADISGIPAIVSRTGYTGELGYELYFNCNDSEAKIIWEAIMNAGKDFGIKPAGLAARDSLRLEMGYCLYGNDIDKSTNPIEAGLGWITKINKGDFIGREAILKVKEKGASQKLTPLILLEKSYPRQGYTVIRDGAEIGRITSGTVSPVLQKPIALAYINSDYAQEGNEVFVQIRNKQIAALIVKLPFVKK